MRIEEVKKKIEDLDGTAFENLCVAIFMKMLGIGFTAGAGTHDGGRDGSYSGPIILKSEFMHEDLEKQALKKHLKWVFQMKAVRSKKVQEIIKNEYDKAIKLRKGLNYNGYVLVVSQDIRDGYGFSEDETVKMLKKLGYEEVLLIGLSTVTQWLFLMRELFEYFFNIDNAQGENSPCTDSEDVVLSIICSYLSDKLITMDNGPTSIQYIISWKWKGFRYYYLKLDVKGNLESIIKIFQLSGYKDRLVIASSSEQHSLLSERISYLPIDINSESSEEELKQHLFSEDNYDIKYHSITNLLPGIEFEQSYRFDVKLTLVQCQKVANLLGAIIEDHFGKPKIIIDTSLYKMEFRTGAKWTVVILNQQKFRVKTSQRIEEFDLPIECKYLRYEGMMENLIDSDDMVSALGQISYMGTFISQKIQWELTKQGYPMSKLSKAMSKEVLM